MRFFGFGFKLGFRVGVTGFRHVGVLGGGGFRVRVPLKIATVSGFLQGLIIQSNGSRKGVDLGLQGCRASGH